MKKILHILVLPQLAGSQKVTLEIYSNLPKLEYDKYVLFSDELVDGRLKACVDSFSKAGVKILFSSNLKRSIGLHDVKAIWEIYKICNKEKFDIVHTNSTKPGIVGRIGAYLAGVPLVVHTVHGIAFHKYESFAKRVIYYLCEFIASFFCHRIILVNKYYLRYYKIWNNKTLTVYNAINYSLLPNLPINRSSNIDAVKLLFVGRLDTPKDPLTLLRAFDILINKYNKESCHLTIVGDGEFSADCSNFVKERRLENYVTFTGWVNNTSCYYATHDIFCLSSIYESFGLIFLDAGYYALPSVATNVEGIPEVIKDGETGFLVPPRRPEMMADKLLLLIENPQLRKEMGICAKENVTSKFTLDRMKKEIENIYNNRK